MIIPMDAFSIVSSTFSATCASPDSFVDIPSQVKFKVELGSGVGGRLRDIGIWLSTNGVSPDKRNSACRSLWLPTDNDYCYDGGGNGCGNVVK
jgi:hypothetical protein